MISSLLTETASKLTKTMPLVSALGHPACNTETTKKQVIKKSVHLSS